MLFTDSLGLTIKSYRCWQLSLTPKMPQLSCWPANLHRYKVIEAAGFCFVKHRHAVKAVREREVPGLECRALQMWRQLHLFAPSKQETKTKSASGHSAEATVRSKFHPFIRFHRSQAGSALIWHGAGRTEGISPVLLFNKVKPDLRLKPKPTTGHIEAVRQLFQILNRLGGIVYISLIAHVNLCTSTQFSQVLLLCLTITVPFFYSALCTFAQLRRKALLLSCSHTHAHTECWANLQKVSETNHVSSQLDSLLMLCDFSGNKGCIAGTQNCM